MAASYTTSQFPRGPRVMCALLSLLVLLLAIPHTTAQHQEKQMVEAATFSPTLPRRHPMHIPAIPGDENLIYNPAQRTDIIDASSVESSSSSSPFDSSSSSSVESSSSSSVDSSSTSPFDSSTTTPGFPSPSPVYPRIIPVTTSTTNPVYPTIIPVFYSSSPVEPSSTSPVKPSSSSS